LKILLILLSNNLWSLFTSLYVSASNSKH
jgi:hypothetical protein